MTENRRIFWNVIATYGRSLYGLVLGLLCGRWALMALGETDYGLNGLVGGLAVFIAFFNNVLAGANARFYAFSIGAAKVAEDRKSALEECRRWSTGCAQAHGIPAYLYGFAHPLPGDEWGANSFHSSELWYVMGTLGRCWRPMQQEDYDLSEEMVCAWTNFMKTGEPSGDWRPYTQEDPYVKIFR